MRWFLEVRRAVRQTAEALGVFVFGAVLAWMAISSSMWVGQHAGFAAGTLTFSTWLAGWWYANRRLKMNEIGRSESGVTSSHGRLYARR